MAQEINRYNTTPRKVFDKHVDAMERKRLRDREDHRNDLKAILRRMENVETQLTLLDQHVQAHCDAIEGSGARSADPDLDDDSTEELE